jgi:hypothetical protein
MEHITDEKLERIRRRSREFIFRMELAGTNSDRDEMSN